MCDLEEFTFNFVAVKCRLCLPKVSIDKASSEEFTLISFNPLMKALPFLSSMIFYYFLWPWRGSKLVSSKSYTCSLYSSAHEIQTLEIVTREIETIAFISCSISQLTNGFQTESRRGEISCWTIAGFFNFACVTWRYSSSCYLMLVHTMLQNLFL